MENIINNKCENCGSELLYDPKAHCLSCKYCGSKRLIKENLLAAKRNYNNSFIESSFESSQLVCENCGNHYTNILAPIFKCLSCGSSSLKKIVSTSILPDGLIPFSIEKYQAGEYFYSWIKKRRFAPNKLKTLAKSQKITASYVPVWNFDYRSIVSYSGVGIKQYKNDDGTINTVRKTFSGNTNMGRDNFLIMANNMFDSCTLRLLNFNISQLKSFDPAYFFGWSALKNNISRETALQNMKNESKKLDDSTIENNVKSDLSFDSIDEYSSKCHYLSIKYNFIYLPVWTNIYVYKNKLYKCYINGQNGNVVSKYPKSWIKILMFVLGIVSIPVIIALLYFLL